jgi:hypothetical protein
VCAAAKQSGSKDFGQKFVRRTGGIAEQHGLRKSLCQSSAQILFECGVARNGIKTGVHPAPPSKRRKVDSSQPRNLHYIRQFSETQRVLTCFSRFKRQVLA